MTNDKQFKKYLVKLGERIAAFRAEKGLTQEDMDEGVYPVSVGTLQPIEYGKVDPRLFTLWRIAKTLDIPLHELLRID